MNEITKIHLGRQPFVIAKDAHAALEAYVHAIDRAVGDKGKEVTEEVELRMAELLAEHKIGPDKVILLKDVAFLKGQLGSPKDFAEDDETGEEAEKPTKAGKEKRLFRDSEHGMLAGVAAGLATYFNIDAVWVRLAFVLGALTGFWGIIAYIILWLVVPEAKTTSEKLQMRGKAVTVDNLKAVIDKADVPGAAKRAGSTARRALKTIAKICLVLIGLAIVAAGVSMVFGLMTGAAFLVFGGGTLTDGALFPVGFAEGALVVIWFVAAVAFAALVLAIGLAIAKRKWVLPTWATAMIIGVLFISLSIGGALTANIAPKVYDRYQALAHTSTTSVQSFNVLNVLGDDTTDFRYVPSSTSSVRVSYRGNGDIASLVTKTENQTLTVDAREFAKSHRCKNICLFHDPRIEIVIYGPDLAKVTSEGSYTPHIQIEGMQNRTLQLQSKLGRISVPSFVADTVTLTKGKQGAWTVNFAGTSEYIARHYIDVYDHTASVYGKNVVLQVDEQCSLDSARIFVGDYETLKLNDTVIASPHELAKLYDTNKPNVYNCVSVGNSWVPHRDDDRQYEMNGAVNGSW